SKRGQILGSRHYELGPCLGLVNQAAQYRPSCLVPSYQSSSPSSHTSRHLLSPYPVRSEQARSSGPTCMLCESVCTFCLSRTCLGYCFCWADPSYSLSGSRHSISMVTWFSDRYPPDS